MEQFHNIILAGGAGKRLARFLPQKDKPKQFIKFEGDQYSFFQKTITRNKTRFPANYIHISSKQKYERIIENQIVEVMEGDSWLGLVDVILEPENVTNTAMAIYYATQNLIERNHIDEEDFLFITPSDHHIEEEERFLTIIDEAKEKIKKDSDKVFLFGAPISEFNPHYGYIQTGTFTSNFISFVEKPEQLEIQERMQDSLTSSWYINSGMVLIRVGRLLELFERETKYVMFVDGQLPSFDSLILENLKKEEAEVIPLRIGWSDIGSWQELNHYLEQKTVHRAWGSYRVIEEGEGYKIKKLVIEPGKKISKQYHMHRSETWTILKDGVAKVTIGEGGPAQVEIIQDKVLFCQQCISIPRYEVHQLENIGKSLLEVIEVQCGEYLEEDDIVRIEEEQ